MFRMCLICTSIGENCSSEEISGYIQWLQEEEGEASANYWGPGLKCLSYVLILSQFALAWRPAKLFHWGLNPFSAALSI
jgi:hypothetical protein